MKISRVDPLPKELDVQIILSPEEAVMLKAMVMAGQNYQTYIVNTFHRISSNQLGNNVLESFMTELKQGLYNASV